MKKHFFCTHSPTKTGGKGGRGAARGPPAAGGGPGRCGCAGRTWAGEGGAAGGSRARRARCPPPAARRPPAEVPSPPFIPPIPTRRVPGGAERALPVSAGGSRCAPVLPGPCSRRGGLREAERGGDPGESRGVPGLGVVPPWVLVPGWRGRSGGRGRARRGAPPAARPPRFSPGLRLSGRGWSRGRSQPCPAFRSHTAAPPPRQPKSFVSPSGQSRAGTGRNSAGGAGSAAGHQGGGAPGAAGFGELVVGKAPRGGNRRVPAQGGGEVPERWVGGQCASLGER